MDVGLFLRV